MDLRPEVEDGKPDIGAYEADPEVYAIPGRQMLTRAGIPVPFDGALAVSRDADLMWLPSQHLFCIQKHFLLHI